MKRVDSNLSDFKDFTKRIEQIESKLSNLEKKNPNSALSQEEIYSHSLTIGSGSSYKFEGNSSTIAKNKVKESLSKTPVQDNRDLKKSVYLDGGKNSESQPGGSNSYESKYSLLDQGFNRSYLRESRYSAYKSNLKGSIAQQGLNRDKNNRYCRTDTETSFNKRDQALNSVE